MLLFFPEFEHECVSWRFVVSEQINKKVLVVIEVPVKRFGYYNIRRQTG